MRLVLGPVPVVEQFDPERDGYQRLPGDVGPLAATVVGTVVGLVAGLLVVNPLAKTEASISLSLGFLPMGAALAVVLAAPLVTLVVIVALHELIHYVLFPASDLGGYRGIGFWPSRLLFYAFNTGPLSKRRIIIVALGPFLALSVVPSLTLSVMGIRSVPAMLIVGFHAWISGGDLVLVGLIARGVPGRATVRNKGWETYCRSQAGVE